MTETGSAETTSTDIFPNQVFEAAARRLFELDPTSHCRLLGLDLEGPPELLPVFGPITLPGDLLLVRVAPQRLAHVLYVFQRPDDLEARLAIYESAIRRAYPGHQVSHHVIVLGDDPDDGPVADDLGT
jgi:hypothetical protein